jgi:hypothetical protein
MSASLAPAAKPGIPCGKTAHEYGQHRGNSIGCIPEGQSKCFDPGNLVNKTRRPGKEETD